jgi:hypothetical protein
MSDVLLPVVILVRSAIAEVGGPCQGRLSPHRRIERRACLSTLVSFLVSIVCNY